MTPRKCILHIGTHKTGTTSVQAALSSRRHALARRGYLYPVTSIPESTFGHHNLAWQVAGDPRFSDETGTLEDLLGEIRGSTQHVVLSSEDFESVATQPDIFAGFVRTLQQGGLDVSLVVYLREQAGYAVSLYLELLKHGLSATFEEFLEEIVDQGMVRWKSWAFPFCYRTFLEQLPSGVPVIVRPYEARGSTVGDFLSLLELTPADLGIGSEPRLNSSLPTSAAFLEFYLNRTNRRAEIAEDLKAAIEEAFGRGDLALSPATRAALTARFSESNRFVESRYNIAGAALDIGSGLAAGASEHERPEHVFSMATFGLVDALVNR
jgi:hypothetical protein